MLIIWYIILGMGAVLSCFLAFCWLKRGTRGNLLLSVAAGAAAGQAWCLNLSPRLSGIVSLVFAAVFLAVMVWQEGRGRKGDGIAAVCLGMSACAAVQVTAGTLLNFSGISLFFRTALIALCMVLGVIVTQALSFGFPGSGWAECFDEETEEEEQRPRTFGAMAGIFVLYALGCVIPAAAGSYSPAALITEWLLFFGGLALVDLLLADRKKDIRILTERQYRDEMQTYMSVIRSQRHDYNFHVQTLHGLLMQKDYDACREYVEELRRDSTEMNRILPLADAAVSALILSFQNQASAMGIQMSIMVENDLSQIATNVYETNKIIGNLLQNAIDEMENLTDRSEEIRLSVIKRGEFAVISVSNPTKDDSPMASYKVGHSRKKGHEGIGIASIQALAGKYGGVVYSTMDGNRICFVAKIPLRLVRGGNSREI